MALFESLLSKCSDIANNKKIMALEANLHAKLGIINKIEEVERILAPEKEIPTEIEDTIDHMEDRL